MGKQGKAGLVENQSLGSSLGLPKLPKLDDGELRKKGEIIRAQAAEARPWEKEAQKFLQGIESLPREERELIPQDQIDAVEGRSNQLKFEDENPPIRRAAWLGFFDYYLSQEVETTKEAKEVLEDLRVKGYLEFNPNGLQISLYSDHYAVSEDSCFGEREYKELQSLINVFLKATEIREKEMWRREAKKLLSENTITIKELLDGKPGTIAFWVPPEKMPENGTPTGWFSGGMLQESSDGNKFRPLTATGRFRDGILEARRLGSFITLASLKDTHPPKVGDHKERDKKSRLLWYLTQRGIKAALEREKRQTQKTQLAAKATDTMKEFFCGNTDGPCLAEYAEVWITPDEERITDVFFLIRREGALITLLEVPEHLGDFFSECVGVFYDEGGKFEGVAQPLRAVLQAIYGQVARAARQEKVEAVA